jgi:hypothetical protein
MIIRIFAPSSQNCWHSSIEGCSACNTAVPCLTSGLRQQIETRVNLLVIKFDSRHFCHCKNLVFDLGSLSNCRKFHVHRPYTVRSNRAQLLSGFPIRHVTLNLNSANLKKSATVSRSVQQNYIRHDCKSLISLTSSICIDLPKKGEGSLWIILLHFCPLQRSI